MDDIKLSYGYSNFDQWSLLNSKAKRFLATIENDWKNLLNQKEKEEVYHQFLADKAGFCLIRAPWVESIVISKLRLGADYVVDFIKTYDHHSGGIQIEFIELETPWSPPFTKKGNPSARLVEAVQQIHNWKQSFKENRYEIQKVLPFGNWGLKRSERYIYTVIIGNRKNSQEWLERRNQYADELGIRIRSFDHLLDNFRNRWYHDTESPHLLEDCSTQQSNELANPFFKAYSDDSWRQLITSYRKSQGRIKFVEALLKYREYNDLLDKFKENVSSL